MPHATHRTATPLLALVFAADLALAQPGAAPAPDPGPRAEVEAEDADLAARLVRPLGLDDCIQIALQRNIGLAVARAARDAARTQVDQAWGEFVPALTLVGTGRRIDASTRERQTDAEAKLVQKLPTGTLVEAGLTFKDTNADSLAGEGRPSLKLTQPLLRDGGWTAATSAVRDARLGATAQDAALRAQVLQLVYDVKAAYLEILRRRQLIEVNERAVTRDEELVAFSRAKVEAQLATTRDVLSAEIVLAQDRGRLVNAEAQYQAGLDQMANVLAVRIARPLEIDTIDLATAPLPVDEDAWVARALRENPGLQQARLELERAELARKLAGNARLPQLDVAVAYDQVRESVTGRVSERGWEGTVTMSYPLLPRAPGGAYRQARLEYDQSRRLLADAERQVVLDVRDAVRNLQRSQDRISILEKNIEGARAKVEFAKVNFQLGRASNLDITDAQKDLLTAETDHVNELVTYRLGAARLEQLLGGSI